MSLFDNEDQPLFPGDELPAIDPSQNYFESLVGEGKKFKSPEELARGKAEADAYIAKLVGELTSLRNEVTSRKRLEELVDQLNSRVTPPSRDGETNPRDPDEDQKEPVDVRQAVTDILSEREREATRQKNLETVKATLSEKLGPGYAAIIKGQAATLGMSPEELSNLAADKPKAFFRLVGIEATPKSGDLFTPPETSVRSDFKPKGDERNYAYWQKLRKENPQEYWRRQPEMHRDATKMGANFYN